MIKKIKFGTDGWRAVIADDFTFHNVRLVSLAIANYLSQNNLDRRGIFVGYDNRFLSEQFSRQVAYVLAGRGNKVYLSSESIPTPVCAFMVIRLNLDGAIMITASHNPPQYNGIKFIPDYGGPAEDKITREIEKNLNNLLQKKSKINDISSIHSGQTKYLDTKIRGKTKNNINYISNFDGYIEKLLSNIDTNLIKKINIKLAVDTMHGAGSKIMPRILKEYLDVDAKILNNSQDPLFGGKLPDPSQDNLDNLKEEVIKNKLDLGIALDGDADRFGVIDGKGIFISPNNVIAIILYYLLKTRKYSKNDIAVRTVATTHLIDEIAKKNNLNVLETPVGFKYIAQQMLKNCVIIGGEESGGLSIKGHIPEKDGLLADLLLIEIASFIKKEYKDMFLSDYLENIYKEFGTFYNIRLDIKIPMDKKEKVLLFFSTLKDKNIGGKKITNINHKDGVKLILEDGSWVLVRPSGTEPLIRCYVESKHSEYFKILENYVKENINNLN